MKQITDEYIMNTSDATILNAMSKAEMLEYMRQLIKEKQKIDEKASQSASNAHFDIETLKRKHEAEKRSLEASIDEERRKATYLRNQTNKILNAGMPSGRPSKVTTGDVMGMISLHSDGFTVRQIAEATGFSFSTVARQLRKSGIMKQRAKAEEKTAD